MGQGYSNRTRVTVQEQVLASSSGLAGKDAPYAMTNYDSHYANSVVLGDGSSNTITMSGTNLYYVVDTLNVPADFSSVASSSMYYVVGSSAPTLPNSMVLTAGSNITILTGGGLITIVGAGVGLGAPTDAEYVTYSDNILLTNERRLTAGSSVIVRTDSTSIYIDALTPTLSANSGGLAGTGGLILAYSSQVSTYPFSKVILAGSSVTTHTDATAFYINATTSLGASSGGLAGTGFYYLVGSSTPGLPNSKIMTAGSSVTMHTDATAVYINATTGAGGGTTEKDFNYFHQATVNTGQFLNNKVRMYLAGQANGLALGATVIPINSACCVPFYTTKAITVDSMGFVATIAGSISSVSQIGIYTNSSDTVLYPFQAVSTSGLIVNSLTTLTGYNPNITLSANNLYWFVIYSARSARTLRTIAVGGAWPIFGMGTDLTTTPGLYLQCPILASGSSLEANMRTGGNIMVTAPPALAIRGSI